MIQLLKTYLSRLEFIFNTMLKAFAFNFHWSQYQAVTNKVCSITDTFWSFKTIKINRNKNKWNAITVIIYSYLERNLQNSIYKRKNAKYSSITTRNASEEAGFCCLLQIFNWRISFISRDVSLNQTAPLKSLFA